MGEIKKEGEEKTSFLTEKLTTTTGAPTTLSSTLLNLV